jgi:hypothetical protein
MAQHRRHVGNPGPAEEADDPLDQCLSPQWKKRFERTHARRAAG